MASFGKSYVSFPLRCDFTISKVVAGHEDSFMDEPRLSTLQALILLLKAREAAPKKGYFFRSWMTVKTVVSMARDLELHEHKALHENGRPCEFDFVECMIKTRVWQTALILEIMVGGPQGEMGTIF